MTIAPRWKHLWCQHGVTGGTLARIWFADLLADGEPYEEARLVPKVAPGCQLWCWSLPLQCITGCITVAKRHVPVISAVEQWTPELIEFQLLTMLFESPFSFSKCEIVCMCVCLCVHVQEALGAIYEGFWPQISLLWHCTNCRYYGYFVLVRNKRKSPTRVVLVPPPSCMQKSKSPTRMLLDTFSKPADFWVGCFSGKHTVHVYKGRWKLSVIWIIDMCVVVLVTDQMTWMCKYKGSSFGLALTGLMQGEG